VLAALLGRLPIGMGSLAVVLLVRESTGDFGAAGLVGGATVAAGAVATPIYGQLIDRVGQPRVLVPAVLANVLFMAALVTAALLEAGTAPLVACGFGIGATNPPLSACMRSLWSHILGKDDRLGSAYALEAIFQEGYFVVGPLIVYGFEVVASPAAAVVAAAASALVGTLIFARSPAVLAWRATHAEDGVRRDGALSRSGVRTLVFVTVFQAAAFGAVYVAMPAFIEEIGRETGSGLLLAALATGSLTAGLIYGSRRWPGTSPQRYLLFSVLFAAGLGPLVLGKSMAGMAGLMVLAGISLAPLGASGYLLIRDLTPPHAVTEAFAWASTAQAAGAALGFGVGGQLVEGRGVETALLFACASAALGAGVALLRRRSLALPAPALAPAPA